MFFRLDSFALLGVDALKVSIEVHLSRGLPGLMMVGLPGPAVNESRQRVRSAILNCGYDFPVKKIIINLSPADLRKEGSFYDLPIALALLAASGQLKTGLAEDSCFIGELSLDGCINPVGGIISMAQKAKSLNKKYFFVPEKIAGQLNFFRGLNIIPCSNLAHTVEILNGDKKIGDYILHGEFKGPGRKRKYIIDFSEVKGQLKAKRGLEIAAAGMHNILLVGPPGSGKSMLARRMVTIMPEMTLEECVEVTKIYSLYENHLRGLMMERPFRNPHHTISRAGLIGGGMNPKPGDISLAHRGILFLDELSQFRSCLIEDLRQPLEDKRVIITRNQHSYCFPCNFILVAATNPCYCGYYGDRGKKCTCSLREIQKFWKNFSGPVMDRIDMKVAVARLKEVDFVEDVSGECSASIRQRTRAAVSTQKKRYAGMNIRYNSEANVGIVNDWIKKDSELKKLVMFAGKKCMLTARGMAGIIRVSRTIADIEGHPGIRQEDLLEALQFRTGNGIYE
ncbi:MAG: YifB family Mg chelatase-like AAA ATPase [Actinobacteria bacterium]|nr:YifB family Mg chelatase-like AAA ATPase [Actinomycetota bacterium]